MNREVCGQCDAPLVLCECFDILTYKRWCNHCKDHVNEKIHHETCEFARLKKENKENNMKVDIPMEQVYEIVRKVLQEAFDDNRYSLEDTWPDTELLSALDRVIEYFSTEKQYLDWRKTVDSHT